MPKTQNLAALYEETKEESKTGVMTEQDQKTLTENPEQRMVREILLT